MTTIIIMNQNIVNKRRVFQNQLRSRQLESIFQRLRSQLVQGFISQKAIQNLNQMLLAIPKSLPNIFQYMKQNQCESAQIVSYLMKNLHYWMKSIEKEAIRIEQWSCAMQILIRMFQNSQNSFNRQLIINQSQQIMVNFGIKASMQHRVLTKEIHLLMLDYYLNGITSIKMVYKSSKYIQRIFQSLFLLNWRNRGKQLVKVVYFCNNILDFAINQEERLIIVQLFLQESSTFISLVTILQQLCQSHMEQQHQNLISLILVFLVNITYFITDKKMWKLIVASELNNFLIHKISQTQRYEPEMQLYLQLSCNLLLGYPEFQSHFKREVIFRANIIQNQTFQPLLEEIRRIYQFNE